MKIIPVTTLFIIGILSAASILADQQAYISENDALRAAEMLNPGAVLRAYCEPCGDDAAEDIKIKSVEAVATGYQTYWEVLVNGSGIDLAYTYVDFDGRWQNMAIVFGLEVSDVPQFLDGEEMTAEEDQAMAKRRFKEVEIEMETVLADASSDLDKQSHKLLIDSQRAWLTYRDVMVEYEITIIDHEGEVERAQYFILERLTRQRIKDLDRSQYQ